jgi:hypothetical protein
VSLPRISNYFGHAKALLHEAVSYLGLKTWVAILFEDTWINYIKCQNRHKKLLKYKFYIRKHLRRYSYFKTKLMSDYKQVGRTATLEQIETQR